MENLYDSDQLEERVEVEDVFFEFINRASS